MALNKKLELERAIQYVIRYLKHRRVNARKNDYCKNFIDSIF